MKKVEFEFLIHCSPRLLYQLVSTPTGLAEWFADKVDMHNDVMSFHWEGSDQTAEIIDHKENEFIRFQWDEDEGTDKYFEFRIDIDSLTNDVALIITDFCENDEEEETRLLWERQVQDLKHSIGA